MTSCYLGDGGWYFACCSCRCCYCWRGVRVWFHYLFVIYSKYNCVDSAVCSEKHRNHNSKCLRFLSIKTQGEKFVHLIISFLVWNVLPHIFLFSSVLFVVMHCVSAVSYFSFIHLFIHSGCAAVVSVWMHRSMSLQFIAKIQIGKEKAIGHLFLANWKTIMLATAARPTAEQQQWLEWKYFWKCTMAAAVTAARLKQDTSKNTNTQF